MRWVGGIRDIHGITPAGIKGSHGTWMEVFTFRNQHRRFEKDSGILPSHSWYMLFHTAPAHRLRSLPQLPLLHSLEQGQRLTCSLLPLYAKDDTGSQGLRVRVHYSLPLNADNIHSSETLSPFLSERLRGLDRFTVHQPKVFCKKPPSQDETSKTKISTKGTYRIRLLWRCDTAGFVAPRCSASSAVGNGHRSFIKIPAEIELTQNEKTVPIFGSSPGKESAMFNSYTATYIRKGLPNTRADLRPVERDSVTTWRPESRSLLTKAATLDNNSHQSHKLGSFRATSYR